jgi:hypothetical protein
MATKPQFVGVGYTIGGVFEDTEGGQDISAALDRCVTTLASDHLDAGGTHRLPSLECLEGRVPPRANLKSRADGIGWLDSHSTRLWIAASGAKRATA